MEFYPDIGILENVQSNGMHWNGLEWNGIGMNRIGMEFIGVEWNEGRTGIERNGLGLE